MPTRTAVITQPNYLPWLGYFEQIVRADVFVFLDSVQFIKREWQNRNRLKGQAGDPFWMVVPVQSHPQKTAIKNILIAKDQPRWRKKHLANISNALGRAPYFREIFPFVESWLNTDFDKLADLNIAGIKMFSELLELQPQFIRASELTVSGRKTELLLNICQEVDASDYYSSLGARVYMAPSEHLFQDADITLKYQTWTHPSYPQRGDNFLSHLSVIDALMNIGPEATRALITNTV